MLTQRAFFCIDSNTKKGTLSQQFVTHVAPPLAQARALIDRTVKVLASSICSKYINTLNAIVVLIRLKTVGCLESLQQDSSNQSEIVMCCHIFPLQLCITPNAWYHSVGTLAVIHNVTTSIISGRGEANYVVFL